MTGKLEKIKFSCFPLLESLALQRTGVESNQGLSVLAPCRHLKYVDVSGCVGIKGPVPACLLRAPGLRLNVHRSGLDGSDTVGNDARAALRWGKRTAPRVPGGPPPP